MTIRPARFCVAAASLAAVTLVSTADAAAAQPPMGSRRVAAQPRPLPQGQRLDAQDGDVLVVEDDARVRVIRRRQAAVRTVYNAAERWVLVIADYATARGQTPDGRVDATFTFRDLTGEWPLGERWEGEAALEEYNVAGDGGAQGFALRVGQRFVQFLRPSDDDYFRDPAALVIGFGGYGRSGSPSGGQGLSFDAAEKREAATAARNAQLRKELPPNTSAGSSSSGGVSVLQGAPTTSPRPGPTSQPPPPQAPVRVGGTIVAPRKIHNVPPEMPQAARQANILGMVILEVTIAPDGSVKDVKVLRSIPMLDAAAVEAARQWRYEPVLLNGVAVPVIMTEVVAFK